MLQYLLKINSNNIKKVLLFSIPLIIISIIILRYYKLDDIVLKRITRYFQSLFDRFINNSLVDSTLASNPKLIKLCNTKCRGKEYPCLDSDNVCVCCST